MNSNPWPSTILILADVCSLALPGASGRRGASAKAVKAEVKATSSSQAEDDTDMQTAASVLHTHTDQATEADQAAVPLMDRLAGRPWCL